MVIIKTIKNNYKPYWFVSITYLKSYISDLILFVHFLILKHELIQRYIILALPR